MQAKTTHFVRAARPTATASGQAILYQIFEDYDAPLSAFKST